MNTPMIAKPAVTNPFAVVKVPMSGASWGFGGRSTQAVWTYSTAPTELYA